MEKPPPLPRFLLLPQEKPAEGEEESGPVVRRYKLARLGQPLPAPKPKPRPKQDGGEEA